jgi:flavin reductase (DIM6/NTAB) family NADH-FMN oxidoreductase RutF
MGLTPGPAAKVRAPLIVEAPINIECRVREVRPLGSHDMFLAEVVNVKADARYLDPRTGAFDLGRAEPLAYAHGQYYALGRRIGKFGFSVERRRKKRPLAAAGRAGKKR